MRADDIPTEITKLAYTAPGPRLSQNAAAATLAHYWPAIEKHVREQVARERAADPDGDACPLHSPTGDPCDCGHDGGADCHPKERR